ncbi:MAG: 3'-5' exonuclease [Prevotellaceae bacterium]|jgi:predicted PolB exonuclease-like 3'-5' exonuclease|nr:3'-5' exonuclease [Prevotellaceae bacterium]
MLNHLNLEHVLFLDVETVPQAASYNELPERIKTLWEKKSVYIRKENQTAEEVYERAGILAEFGKIICISAGYIHEGEKGKVFRVKSFYGDDEKLLLTQFCASLHAFFAKRRNAQLCAHNGKEFDFPYIARRILINSLPLPAVLDMAGRKPWEVPFLDTMELWKFGDYKHFCSLDLLTTILDIPTPKDDIDGSRVAAVYYEEKNIARIVQYCEKDAMAVAQLLLRYRGEPLLPDMERAGE